MDKAQIIEFIKKIELLKELTDEELNLIASNLQEKTCNKDELLFRENNPRKDVYLIYDGEVELFKKTSYGEETRLSFFSKYDFLAEGSLIDDSPHSTSARALLKTKIFFISRDKFTELVKENGAISVKIYSQISRVISRRMRHANTRVSNVGAQYESGRTRNEHDLLGDRVEFNNT